MSTCIDREFEEHLCKVEMLSFPFVKLKFSVYGRKQTYIHTYIHTYTRVSQCSHASVGLVQARPNNPYKARFEV